MAASRVFWIINTLSVGLLVARRLGPEKFGILNYAVSFATIMFMLIIGGVDPIVAMKVVKEPLHRDRILGNTFFLRTVLFIILFSASVTILAFSHQSMQIKIICLIVSASYSGYVFQSIQPYFQGTAQNQYSAFCLIGSFALYAGIRIFALVTNASLYTYAVAEFALNFSVNVFLLLAYWRRAGSPLKWRIDLPGLRNLLKPFFALSVCGLAFIVFSKTDILMLEHFLGAASVGHYSVATKISDTFNVFGSILLTTLFPSVIAASSVSSGEYEKSLGRLYCLLFVAMVAAAILTNLCSRIIVLLMFGDAFLPACAPLRIYVWSLPAFFMLSTFGSWSLNEDQLSGYVLAVVFSAVLNVTVNYLLIPRIGINGAAVSTVLSLWVGVSGLFLFSANGRKQLSCIKKYLCELP